MLLQGPKKNSLVLEALAHPCRALLFARIIAALDPWMQVSY